MAYTTISRITLDPPDSDGGPTGYFHPQDIAMVLNQSDANGLPAIAVELRTAVTVKGRVSCNVLVAVTKIENGVATERLTGPNHLVAVKCPPLNHPGGVFLDTP